MGLAIVAIPEEQDRVWKFSSEKVPHLTLLFLGDEESADTQQIVQFVEHATQLSEHGPFYLDVESRGELGADNADVLFFSKRSWNLKWIKQFRGQLLQNDAVRTAYDSAEQFGAPQDWLPHLTMGYPATPAKPLPDDSFDHPFYSVCFDRIAVWLGDFDGPEFKLEWPDRPEALDGPLAVAWADEQKKALTHYAMMDPDGELEHYGVKGMRWGHTTKGGSEGGTARAAASKSVAKGAKFVGKKTSNTAFRVKANSTVRITKLVNEASKRTKNNDLPAINAKHKALGAKTSKEPYLTGTSRVPAQKAYRNEVRAAYEKNLNAAAKETTNKSGTLRYEIGPALLSGAQTPTRWRVKTVQVKHADSSADEFDVVLTFDDDGFIVDFKHEPVQQEETLEQTALTTLKGEDFVGFLVHGIPEDGEAFILEHYGVKGMRWGHTTKNGSGRSGAEAVAPSATSRVPQGNRRKTKIKAEGGQNHPAHEDAIKVAEAKVKLKKSGPAALSNKELQDVQTRLNLERNVSGLMANSSRVARGRNFVKKVTGNVQDVNTTVNTGLQSARLAEQLRGK